MKTAGAQRSAPAGRERDGSGEWFGGLFTGGVGGVDDDGDVEAAEVVFDERFDV